nr:MAG TPA: hypothetical protein [Caudoviricetes sp.]
MPHQEARISFFYCSYTQELRSINHSRLNSIRREFCTNFRGIDGLLTKSVSYLSFLLRARE